MERFKSLLEPKVLQVTVVAVTGMVSGSYPYVQLRVSDNTYNTSVKVGTQGLQWHESMGIKVHCLSLTEGCMTPVEVLNIEIRDLANKSSQKLMPAQLTLRNLRKGIPELVHVDTGNGCVSLLLEAVNFGFGHVDTPPLSVARSLQVEAITFGEQGVM